jgi:tetratricopeptide (TPR) repeat protein
MRRKGTLAISLALLLSLSAGALYAQSKGPTKADREKARALFEEGEAYYNIGEFEKALEGYKQAYILSREPALLYNMAQCYRQLGRAEEAIRTYRNFLKELPESPLRPKVEEFIAELEKPKTTTPVTPEIKPDETPASSPASAPTSLALAPPNLQPVEPPKKPRTKLYLAVGGAVVGGIALTAVIASAGDGGQQQPPSTDFGTFRPF